MQYQFKIEGTFPILFHADDVEQSDLLKEWREASENKNFSVKGDDRSPPWTWMTYLYGDGEHIAWPSANLMVCLRAAGAQIILKKQKTFKEISQSGIVPCDEFFRFENRGKQIKMDDIQNIKDEAFAAQAEAVRGMGFKLFVKRAKVGQAKHVRVRARFENWSVHGAVNVVAPEITFEVLEKLFDLAGRVGLGDWRPGCKTPGPYGQFVATVKRCKETA